MKSTLASTFRVDNPTVAMWLLAASLVSLPAYSADSKEKPKTAAPSKPAATGAKPATTSSASKPSATSKPAAASAAKTPAGAPVATVAGTGKPSVIDFSAEWCGPCKKFAPIYDKVASNYKGKVDFFHVDTEDAKNKALVDKFSVSVMPTIVFRDAAGKAKLINEGVMEEKTLVQEVNNLLK